MQYLNKKFKVTIDFETKAVHWLNSHPYGAYFNPCHFDQYPHGAFKKFLAAGTKKLTFDGINDFQQLATKHKQNWLIGHFSYDLKNQLEKLKSQNASLIGFPDIHFFVPEHIIFFISPTEAEICSLKNPDDIFSEINRAENEQRKNHISNPKPLTTKEEYINTVQKLKDHILEGDIYEINYCMAFYFEKLKINPADYYFQLINNSPAPFSTFYKINELYAISASPERFLKKQGEQIISQPIKGTAPRSTYPREDSRNKTLLQTSIKERAENMMIVDLVRNDLARSSVTGSVQVEEMFGVYSFKYWHQMISTVKSELHPDRHFIQAISNAFPMGSMTGAPKIKVMELIETYENFRRGLYAGAIGYIEPNKDFDFSVVIRTLFYDAKNKSGALMAGSAITYDSDPELEYKECLLKVAPLLNALNGL